MPNQQQERDNDIILPVGTKLKLEVKALPGTLETFTVVKAFNLKEELEKISIPPDKSDRGNGLHDQSKLATHLLTEGFVTYFTQPH